MNSAISMILRRRAIAGVVIVAGALSMPPSLPLRLPLPGADASMTRATTADASAPPTLRGYLLDRPSRTFTTIEPPDAVATKLGEINDRGAIVGGYSDGTAVHNFIRDHRGRYTTFDPPGAGGVETGTQDINDRG